MDADQITALATAHGQAVVAMDVDHIKQDLIAELHPAIPDVAAAVPQPLESATLDAVEVHDDHAETLMTYASPSEAMQFRTRWEDRGAGRPQIVSSTPV